MYSMEEYDRLKSKVLKYVLYKKRTENEVKQKFFNEIDENILENIIYELKENLYINDYQYIQKSVKEYMNLKILSIKEIKYKLYLKGIDLKLIESYINKNIEELQDYERKSAYKIATKKINIMNKEDIIMFLLKKGYEKSSIDNALDGGL